MPGEPTVTERCLLYLLDRADVAEDLPGADALVQDRIAESLGIRRAHVSRAMVRFRSSGLVRAAHVHVRGATRRRLAYFLTDAGLRRAKDVRRQFEERRVVIIDTSGAESERRLYEVPLLLPRRPRFSDLVGSLEGNRLDLRRFVDRQARVHSGKVFDVREAAPVPHFQGRQDELARLDAFVEEATVRGCLLIGLPGIGKTTLAAQWVGSLRARAHILWRRIRPDTTPGDLLHDIAEMLRAAGRPALAEYLRSPPDSPRDESAELLRRDLFDLKAVLVFDDGHAATDLVIRFVRDTLIADGRSGGKVLVLARERVPVFSPANLVLGRAWEIELDDLPRNDAAALLEAIGVETGRRDEILRKCGGHPLLIELAAKGRVSLEGIRRVSAARLAQEVFSNLDADSREPLELAAVFNGPVPRKLLGSAAGDLLRRCLVREVGDDALGLHDLVRDAVLESIPSNRVQSIHGRAGEYLRRSPSPGDAFAAVQHFLAAERFDDAHDLLETRGDELIQAGLAESLAPLFDDILRVRSDPRMRLFRGHALFARGLWAEATEAYERAAQGADSLTAAEALLGEGKSEHHRESRLALGMLLEARNRLESLGALRLLAEAQYWIGGVHQSAGRLAEAREALEKGRAVAFDVGDRQWEGVCAYGIGKVLSLAGDYAAAVEQVFDALRLLERTGSRIDIAKVCAGLGGNLLEVRRMEEAETYLRRAASEARAVGAIGTLTSALYNLASLKTIVHKIPEAIEFFDEAMDLYVGQEKYDRATWCAAWLAHCHWVLGNARRAEELWQRAGRFLSKSPEAALRVRALRRMASAATEAGQMDLGREALHRARAEAQSARLHRLLSEVDADLANPAEPASSPTREAVERSEVRSAD